MAAVSSSLYDRFVGLIPIAKKMRISRGDICKLEVDGIVNAANRQLLAGGGVCGAIFSAAGYEELSDACDKIDGGCATGETVITPGFNLPAKHVLHTVGPMGRNDEKLSSCYRTTLDLCKRHGLRTVAFPCISTGIYGFPNGPASKIALKTCRDWLLENEDSMDMITFAIFLEVDNELYEKHIPTILGSDQKEKSTPSTP